MSGKVDGLVCVVTGGCGFVGHRLCEMLLERGALEVVSFDVSPPPSWAKEDNGIKYVTGDITDFNAVSDVCQKADCVWHVAALVGPFHKKEAYMAVNYKGTVNVIEACKKHKVPRIIMSSSPSTRFDGSDVDGLAEDDLPFPMSSYLQLYAESKAMGEMTLRTACCDELMTVAIAPHQVYGPHDMLFLPNLLSAAAKGWLRIFGNGRNRISVCYVDNYCHALILGYNALYKGSPALGKFYIVTDGGYQLFWRMIDSAAVHIGCTSLFMKAKLPFLLMMFVAYIFNVLGWILGRKMRVTPFTVKMLTMHRWFDISAARKDLKYEPVVSYEDGWRNTLQWLSDEWLPSSGLVLGDR